jgi:hypothetical protein
MIAATLKLVTAEGFTESPRTSREQQRRWSLREAYEQTLRRDQEARGYAPSTISEYHGMLTHWEKWSARADYPILITDIDDDLLEQFADWLSASGKRGRTVNKNVGYVEAILRRCGPKGPRNKRGRGVLQEYAFAERRSENDSKPKARVMPLEAMERLYAACRIAKRPAHVRTPPPLTWRTLLLIGFTYGLRRDDLFLLSSDSVTFETECPQEDVKLSHPWGWLQFTPEKTKHRKPEPLVLPLTKGLHHHLKQVEGIAGRLLPFATCHRDWYVEWRAIQKEAGIARPYMFKELRKTANVEWDSLPGDAFGLGAYVLGHAARDVNSRHYKAAVRKVCSLIDSFPMADRMPD